MASLIGNGGHAQDIRDTETYGRTVTHHSKFAAARRNGPYVIGINDPQVRAKVAAEIGRPDDDWRHPWSHVGPDCDWGPGTHINYGVMMTRTRLGHHVTVSPGVIICGDVSVGDRTLIGAGAVICDRVTIGADVIIGAGAVILPETVVGDGETWVGNPARRLR